MHSNFTIKHVSWPHFSWATLYTKSDCFNWQLQVFLNVKYWQCNGYMVCSTVNQLIGPSNLRVEPSDTWAVVSWRPAFTANLLPYYRHHYVLWYLRITVTLKRFTGLLLLLLLFLRPSVSMIIITILLLLFLLYYYYVFSCSAFYYVIISNNVR